MPCEQTEGDLPPVSANISTPPLYMQNFLQEMSAVYLLHLENPSEPDKELLEGMKISFVSESSERHGVGYGVAMELYEMQLPHAEWFRLMWARRIEPSRVMPHPLAAIIVRIRLSKVTEIERMFLSWQVISAINKEDLNLLDDIGKLTALPLRREEAVFQLQRAGSTFINQKGRYPRNSELKRFIQSHQEEYPLIDLNNWSRSVRRAGIGSLFSSAH